MNLPIYLQFKQTSLLIGCLSIATTLSTSPLSAQQSAQDTIPKISNTDTLKTLQNSVTEIIPKVMPATVCIVSPRTGASGSGVIVDPKGLILTASHVIEGEEEVTVLFPDGRQQTAKILGANFTKDAAMAQLVSEDAEKLWPYAPLGSSDDLNIGEFVIALGHSEGFDPVRTPPVRFGRIVSMNATRFLSSDCALIGGDSGGPLFNLKGEVVAIHSSIGRSAMANNHAGVDGFKEDWEELKSGKIWGSLSMHPFVNSESPVVGFEISTTQSGEVIVVRVIQGGPAEQAGIQNGDIIWEVGNERIESNHTLLKELSRHQPGKPIEMVIKRGDVLLELAVNSLKRSDFYKP